MARRAVKLYYDVTSPYSWLAFEVLCRYRVPWNMDLKFQPVFLGGIMHASGNQPPGLLPPRGKYMVKDLRRLSSFMDIPLKHSQSAWEYIMGKGTLIAQRFLTAVSLECPTHLEVLSRSLWIRLWSNGLEIHEPDTLRQICREAGISPDVSQKLIAMSTEKKIKELLKSETDKVVDFGGFGLPVYSTDLPGFDEPQWFFGTDRLELFASTIGKPWLGPNPQKPSKL